MLQLVQYITIQTYSNDMLRRKTYVLVVQRHGGQRRIRLLCLSHTLYDQVIHVAYLVGHHCVFGYAHTEVYIY